MSYILPYFARLGLGQDAPASDIRRAYARELKLIDQEHDAAGFQQLRQAYEMSMQWARHQASAAVPAEVAQFDVESVPVTLGKAVPPVAPAAALFPKRTQSQVDPHALASAVFAAFVREFNAMLQGAIVPDLPLCAAVLARALDDPALLHIGARRLFEGRVAHLLAAGWKPGHEILLVAAVKAFAWRDDRRLLCAFGEDGARLSQAIDERTMFDTLPIVELMELGQVVARLRVAAPPDIGVLAHGMRHVALLEARFPMWLELVTDVGNIPRWRELDEQIPGWRRMLVFERKAKPVAPSRDSEGGLGFGGWMVAVLIINMIRLALQYAS